jgi:hypothetical protein
MVAIFRQTSHTIKGKSLKHPADARSKMQKARSETYNELEFLRLLAV